MIQARERLVRLALVIKFVPRLPGKVAPREARKVTPALSTKAAEPHNREALPPFVRYAQAEHVCLLGNYRRHVRHLGQALR